MLCVTAVGISLVLIILIYNYKGKNFKELDFVTWEFPSVTR